MQGLYESCIITCTRVRCCIKSVSYICETREKITYVLKIFGIVYNEIIKYVTTVTKVMKDEEFHSLNLCAKIE